MARGDLWQQGAGQEAWPWANYTIRTVRIDRATLLEKIRRGEDARWPGRPGSTSTGIGPGWRENQFRTATAHLAVRSSRKFRQKIRDRFVTVKMVPMQFVLMHCLKLGMAQVRSSGIASARRQVGPQGCSEQRLLELLLGAELLGVTALLLPAVVCTGGKASIAPASENCLSVSLSLSVCL